jgi:hypothetical protein
LRIAVAPQACVHAHGRDARVARATRPCYGFGPLIEPGAHPPFACFTIRTLNEDAPRGASTQPPNVHAGGSPVSRCAEVTAQVVYALSRRANGARSRSSSAFPDSIRVIISVIAAAAAWPWASLAAIKPGATALVTAGAVLPEFEPFPAKPERRLELTTTGVDANRGVTINHDSASKQTAANPASSTMTMIRRRTEPAGGGA